MLLGDSFHTVFHNNYYASFMHRLIASDSILVTYDGQFGHYARTACT